MDWKLFPPAQASVRYQECTQQNRISMERLCYNLDALLRRDKRDGLSKQLHGLLNNTKIYQVKVGNQRTPTTEKLKARSNLERAGKCNSGKDEYYEQLSRKYLNTDGRTELTDSEASRSRDGKSSSDVNNKFSAKEAGTSRRNSTTFLSSKCKNRRQLPMNLDLYNGEVDVLPSNGWWLEQRSSDSETETDINVDCTASPNLNRKNYDFGSSTSTCSSIENDPRSLVASKNRHRGAELHERKDSFSDQLSEAYRMLPCEQSGEGDFCNIFELTSRTGDEEESFSVVPSPPTTSPVTDDKGSESRRFIDKPPSSLSLSQPLYNAHDTGIFDDNLTLEYGELLRHRPNTASRITYTTLEKSYSTNYVTQGIGRIIKEFGHSRRILEKRNKIQCVLPKVNNNTTPAVYLRNASKRCPNTATTLVKLRFKHIDKSGVSGKLTEDKDTDERVLPTTLNKSADASYSIMTPYMANIVWSVMEDEKVR